jgi:hypothetical protein
MRFNPMPRLLFSILAFSILALTLRTASCINPHATLEQLKTLDIVCFVPSYLPKGFKLKSVAITYDEPGPDEWSRRESSDIDGKADRPSERERTSQGGAGRFPLYYLEYGDNHGGSFTVDSAREGIGDRNLMETEDSEETTIASPFGPMYLIYTPKTASSGSGRLDDMKSHPQGDLRGETKVVKEQGKAGLKKEIKANWARDDNMKAENAKALVHPILGRYHGFSATRITVAEFEKIINSLRAIRP